MTIPSHMLPPGNHAQAMHAALDTIAAGVNYSCLAALIGIVLDYADTLSGEARYIWTLRIGQPKLTYLLSRYLSIIFQVFIVISSFRSGIEGSRAPVPFEICRQRFTLMTFAAYAINVIGNYNLMQRAYILNMRSKKVLIFLSLLVMAEYATAAVLGTSTMKMFVFDRRCNATNVSWTIFITMTPKIFLQGGIWALTYSKLESGSIEGTGMKTFDGGKWTWFMFHGLTVIFIPLAFTRQCVRPDVVFSWPITIMSVGTCRLVLSSEKIKYHMIWKQSPSQPLPMNSLHLSTSTTVAPVDISSYDSAISRIAVRSGGHIADIAINEPTSPPTTLTSLSGSDLDRDAEGSRMSSDNMTAFDGQQNGYESDRFEIGSSHTSSSMDSVARRAYWDELYAATVSRISVWLGSHVVDIAVAQPASPPTSLATDPRSNFDRRAEGSGLPSDTGSTFDGQQSEDSSDRIEIGSERTASSMDSVAQRAYWNRLYCRSVMWSSDQVANIAISQPASPLISLPTSLPSLTWSNSDLYDTEGSRQSFDIGASVFDDGQQSGDGSGRTSVEIGSAHTSSSMDSDMQRTYWNELYAAHG